MKTVKERPVMETATEVVRALRAKYPGDAYAFMEQVGNATGFKCKRHCDALVMSLWPSRGLDIIGIEVKVRRSDWLKELETPEKADEIARYCDYWYLAVGDENIVQAGELPSTWGLLAPTADGKLRCKVEAKKLEPIGLDRSFIAGVLRQATGQLTDEAKMRAEYDRGVTAGSEAEKQHYKSMSGYYKKDLDDLREVCAKFEKASGVSVRYAWNAEKIGDAVRRVMNGCDAKVREDLSRLHTKALDIAKGIEMELGKE